MSSHTIRAGDISPYISNSKDHSLTKQKPSRNLLVIEQSITQLLLATKQLLDILTSWSQQQATKAEVSDIYVRLGTEFRMVCRACTVVGIETSDLGDVPEALKKILETALSQDPSRQNLDVYMPEIREVIINLLNGLKKKQQTARRNEPYTVCTTKREEGAPADLSHHLNATSRARVPSAIKSLYKYFMVPGMTNLAGGAYFLLSLSCSSLYTYIDPYSGRPPIPWLLPLRHSRIFHSHTDSFRPEDRCGIPFPLPYRPVHAVLFILAILFRQQASTFLRRRQIIHSLLNPQVLPPHSARSPGRCLHRTTIHSSQRHGPSRRLRQRLRTKPPPRRPHPIHQPGTGDPPNMR